MYFNSNVYQDTALGICQKIQSKITGIQMHTCNISWMAIFLSHRKKCLLQMPPIIQYRRKMEENSALTVDTVPLSELARMIDQLRSIYIKERIATNLLPYEEQLQIMLTHYRNGTDKKQIMRSAIDYIEMLRHDLQNRGITIHMASKDELLNQYIASQNREFEELANLMDNVKKNYETQGYIVNLLPYEDQIKKMQAAFEQGKSKQDVLMEALNQMEMAKNMLARNGVSTDLFPQEESLEKYYIGNDKDYVELSKLCDEIHRVYESHGLPSPMLSYPEQLHWIEQRKKKGTPKETILKTMIEAVEKAKDDLKSKNIVYNTISKEDLFKRYSIREDTVFISLAQLVDNVRSFYLTNRLNTQLLPYEMILKVMKDAHQDGIPESAIVRTILNTIEECRLDLASKGYPITIPSQEQLKQQYNIEDDSKQL